MRNLNSKPWNELKNACYERDKFTCRKCKKTFSKGKLHAHHIIPFCKGGQDNLENLISVCSVCHTKLENQYRRVGITRYVRDYLEENQRLSSKEN